jgi:hypothetical protein
MTIQLYLDIVTYSRLPFSRWLRAELCRLLFRSFTVYLTRGNTLIIVLRFSVRIYYHLSLHIFFDPCRAIDSCGDGM